MSEFINELKQEHKEISAMLKRLRMVSARSKEGQELLESSKAKLLHHLQKEDNKLYPRLKEKAKTDTSLKRTLDIFDSEMDGITKFVITFYEKYMNKNELIDTETFINDIAKFINTLQTRILKEEIALYKLYEDLEANI